MEKSGLEKLSDKQLVYIGLKLLKSNFDYTAPYDDFTKSFEQVSNILKYFGIDSSPIDVEYISKFIWLNEDNFISLEKNNSVDITDMTFERPVAKNYRVFYQVWGPATYTEKYSTKKSSYHKEWASDGLVADYDEGVFNYYDGDYNEHEVDNWEVDEFRVDFVQPITENSINSLKKDSLLELRNLIDKRLKNL